MDIICFSHLRWNFVYQRPQHLFSRFARHFRVFYIEEPLYDADQAFLEDSQSPEGVHILVPHLPAGTDEVTAVVIQHQLLESQFTRLKVTDHICWYLTPMALTLGGRMAPVLTVYDCMDELSAFKNAPPAVCRKEAELLKLADIVFTGGYSLYKAKKHLHENIYPFPSSIDKQHFSKARTVKQEPDDQKAIPKPRIGFFGVIDERMDTILLETIARLRPEWNYILVGPTVKIDPASLPVLPNIYYLGSKSYAELPAYLAGWNVAMMPFALNESTRYISPTKTPEYLAGGVPVISTAIQDVIDPYEKNGLVYIGHSPQDFIEGIEQQLNRKARKKWLHTVDSFLENNSWDNTADKMLERIRQQLQKKNKSKFQKKENAYV